MKWHPIFDILFIAVGAPDRDEHAFDPVAEAQMEFVLDGRLTVDWWPGWIDMDELDKAMMRSEIVARQEDRRFIAELLCG